MSPRVLSGALMLILLLACTDRPALLEPSPPEAGNSVTPPAIDGAAVAAIDDALSRIVPTLGNHPAVVTLQDGLQELRNGLLAGSAQAHRDGTETAERALSRLARPESDILPELEAVRLAIATSAVR